MPNCAREGQTQHYLGARYGFGPVKDREDVLLAIFEKTKRAADKIIAKSWKILI